ncbi:response regulator [uncultured Tateyamaria sp.]|uniref:response regulator n=1 Tax=Tateyamaria sp. 1078 TaxID=3417464 RepID=UPI0026149F76|nr:response regulator [uncultured Tateyamaria sp.]
MKDQTILVVEDDQKIRHLLRNVLEGEGARVIEAETAAEVMQVIGDTPLNLITLDLHLGADNGVDIAQQIRAVSQVPIIMVTGKDDVIDRVVGLEVGADDYITKPFHIREVIARVRSVLRRTGAPAPTPDADAAPSSAHFCFDGMTAYPDRLELIDRDSSPCELTSGDFKLLNVFLNRPKRVLSRDQLMDLTGGIEWSPLDRTIDNQVARLRKKIERDPSKPQLIKTVRGIGYTFASDVKVVQSPPVSAKSA